MRVGGGSISGRVVDQAGNGVAGATVDAWQRTDASYRDGCWGRSTTDGSGNFTIAHPTTPNGLPTGTYFLKASKAGLPDGVKDNIPVTAGNATTGVQLSQVGGTSAVSGTVRRIGGSAVANATVYLDGPLGAAQTTTNAAGQWLASNLPAATYHVVVTAVGYASAHRYGVTVATGQGQSGIDFLLDTAVGTVTGTVTDASTGLPLSDVTLFADSLQGDGWGQAVSAVDGTYAMHGLAPMTYYVHARKPGYVGKTRIVTVMAGATMVGHDIALPLANATITGRVTAGSAPVPAAGITIDLAVVTDEPVDVSCFTGADGTYTCGGLAGGSYDVHVFGVPGLTNQVRYFVEVADGGTATADFDLTNGVAAIRGQVRGAGGKPLVGAKIQAFQKASPGTWGTTTADGEGRYELTGLWGGVYLVTADLPGMAQLRRDFVDVAASGVTLVNLPGDSGGGPGSEPASNACLAAVTATGPSATATRVRLTMTGDTATKFTLKGRLPAASFDPTREALTLALRSDALTCITLPVGWAVRKGNGSTYRDRRGLRSGLTAVTLKAVGGGLTFALTGRGVPLSGTSLQSLAFGFDLGGRPIGGTVALRRRGAKYLGP